MRSSNFSSGAVPGVDALRLQSTAEEAAQQPGAEYQRREKRLAEPVDFRSPDQVHHDGGRRDDPKRKPGGHNAVANRKAAPLQPCCTTRAEYKCRKYANVAPQGEAGVIGADKGCGRRERNCQDCRDCEAHTDGGSIESI